MFVKNYYEAIRALEETQSGITKWTNGTLIAPDGVAYSPYICSAGALYTSNTVYLRCDATLIRPCTLFNGVIGDITNTGKYGSKWSIAFGNGDTEPKITDYTLSGELVSGLSTLEQNITREYENGVCTFQSQMVVKNTGADAVTIKEVALLYPMAMNEYLYSPSRYFMMERSLLDEPVIIEAGCSANVNYKVSYTVPTMPS